MNFYYPWIDPRVKRVRPANLLTYLREQGWLEDEASRPNFFCYRHPIKEAAVYVPALEEADDFALCILEAVTQVAKIEERFAGDVLNELLPPCVSEGGEKVAPTAKEKSEPLAHPANH